MMRVATVANAPHQTMRDRLLPQRTQTTAVSSGEPKQTRKRRPIPPPLKLEPEAAHFFRSLLDAVPTADGVILKYERAQGSLSMAFKYDFIRKGELGPLDERVPLERADERALFVHRGALMKACLDMDHIHGIQTRLAVACI